jgi:hypothetical protein
MSTICIKLSCLETTEIVGNDVYASFFYDFFGLEWSVAERITEKSRRRFDGLTASLRDGMPRNSYNLRYHADVFCYRKALHSKIIIRTSRFAHGAFDAVFFQHTFVCPATVLTFAVAVGNKSLVPSVILSPSDTPCWYRFQNLRLRFAVLKHILDGLQLHFFVILDLSHCGILSLSR